MAEYLSVEDFLSLAQNEAYPIVDVRSPSEYNHAHIPGAVSIPVFNDDQRAVVGTLYKKQGRVQAVQKGLEFVGPELKSFTKKALALKSDTVLVHCWRGGMRSASMAWLFETVGLKVYLLDGGYKSYRNYVLDYFSRDYKLIVLGGCTGAGKTDILQELENRGEQVVDLEGLANHKGSAFGAIGQMQQPSTEHFEHLFFNKLRNMDIQKPIWVEDESANVGRIFIPKDFFARLRGSSLIKVDADYEIRLSRIMRDYACLDVNALCESIKKLEKRLGFDKTKEAVNFCESGDIESAVRICLAYYDKLYNSSLEKRFTTENNFINFAISTLDPNEFVEELIVVGRSIYGR